jgi:hypothetical protein
MDHYFAGFYEHFSNSSKNISNIRVLRLVCVVKAKSHFLTILLKISLRISRQFEFITIAKLGERWMLR